MKKVIEIHNLSKLYRLGEVGTGSLGNDLNRWWQTRILGKEDPYTLIGERNKRDEVAGSDFVWALHDINLDVYEGDVVGIIGANGAGKSTLLKLISRITAPTKGYIKAKGRIGSLLEVGTGMHPDMTARENIFLNGAILGMTRYEIRQKFDEIIDFAGVVKYVDTPVKRFSSGMRVRLGFAVAAFLEPEILIVDEVLAVGDADFQKRAIGKMKEVSSGDGRTVLFVSHNMGSIESLCTSGIVLANGSTVFSGSQSSSIEYYLKHSKSGQINSIEKGSKEIKIDSIEFFDKSMNRLSFLKTGEDFNVFLNYSMKREADHLENINVSISFYDQKGIKIFTHSNRLVSLNISYQDLLGNNAISVSIKKLPIPRGTYSIQTTIFQGISPIHVNESIADIEVLDAPFGSNEINPHPVHGTCLVNADWSLVKN